MPGRWPLDPFVVLDLRDDLDVAALLTEDVTNGAHAVTTPDERREDDVNLKNEQNAQSRPCNGDKNLKNLLRFI